MRWTAFIPALWLAGLALVGCGEPPALLAQSSADIVARAAADAAIVRPGELVFPSDTIGPGLRDRIDAYAQRRGTAAADDVEQVLLVGDRSQAALLPDGHIDIDSGNPFGFTRRALSYREQGDELVIETEDVGVDEVLEELDASGQAFIGEPVGTTERDEADGAHIVELPPIDLSGIEIYRNGDDYVRLPAASLKLALRVDSGLEMSWFRLEHAHVDVGADVQAKLAFEARLVGSPVAPQLTAEVAAMHFVLPNLGPIPQTLVLSLRVGCQHPAPGELSAGVSVDTGFDVGFTYDRGEGVRPMGAAHFTSSATADVHASLPIALEPKCFLEPRFEVLFFDVAGPLAKVRLYGALTQDPPEVALHAGLEGRIGGTLRVLGWHVADLSAPVFDLRKEVWRGTSTSP